jgi:hypothetical protein
VTIALPTQSIQRTSHCYPLRIIKDNVGLDQPPEAS